MRTNLKHVEVKKEITAKKMRVKLVKKRTNLEHFEAKKQITAQTTRFKMVKQ